MSRYRFVEAESRRYSVTQLCRIAQVSRTAYYEWQDGQPSQRERDDAALTAKIRAIHAASDGQYGVPRVLAELRAQGHDVGRKRVARLMKAAGPARATPAALGADDDAGADAARDPRSRARAVRQRRLPTCCGSATSPTSARGRAGCTWRRSSTSSRAA